MKKIAVLAACLALLPCCAITAHAEEQNEAIISADVPYTHNLTVSANETVGILLNYKWISNGEPYTVDRLSRQYVILSLSKTQNVVKATLNGEDITDDVVIERYKYIASYAIPSMYRDMDLQFEIKDDLPQTGYFGTDGLIEISAALLTAAGILMTMKACKRKED